MGLMKKNEWWLLLVFILQLACISIANYLFTKDIAEIARNVERSLSGSGMSVEQVNAIAQAISSIGDNVSWFVSATGFLLIQINLVVFLKISKITGEE